MIKLKNLTKKYGDTVILDDISYNFPQKGLACILGASGCGKSTLLNLLAGFDTDYSGEINVCGSSISDMNISKLCDYRRDNIGFVFQNYHLLSGYTVLDNILLACELNSDGLEINISKAKVILDKVGILEKANEKVENLSGGQKQRVAIARALITNPKIIFADEPTGALDRDTSSEIMKLINKIADERLVVLITHDKKICDFADEIITIESGKIKVLQTSFSDKVMEEKNSLNAKAAVKVSAMNRAMKNFKVHLKRYIAVSLAISIGICAFILSLSSGNIMKKSILDFKEKNTAFNNGYIKVSDDGTILDLLAKDERIENIYYQYPLKNITLILDGKSEAVTEKIPTPKANESMSYGIMPRRGLTEIAITPSLAKKFASNINTIIGKTILFKFNNFSETLTISGIYNAGYDDFFISSDIEQKLYKYSGDQKNYSISYDVKEFDHIVAVSNMLELKGIASKNASKDVSALQDTFNSLNTLFLILSILIFAIGLFISTILLVKLQNSRYREVGLLSALGFSKEIIQKIILGENLLLSCMATAVNVVLITLAYLARGVVDFPVVITLVQAIGSMIATFAIVLFVSIVVSYKLINTEPATALRK
ncbi:ATP-binding cassette domain-containing protein [Clostridium estertheticum]|uniref:ABC transporter ATP-binding protein/permease n=1 Tax=Clostridium estertheticum TaxID=238834 RepID=UPI0013E97BEF|nr:ATP-binding cassette domain-containing protein [Clostridium estertheticum]MBZ9685664.1 ATP-binding cassette domain-containing protein [Clostridium estertheticum]